MNVPSSDSRPNTSVPELAITASESPQSSTNDQEIGRPNGISDTAHSAEIESLQKRLKEVEQRFSGITPFLHSRSSNVLIFISDVSTSFKRLQAEKLAADALLKENTPMESFSDPDALGAYFSNLRVKDEVYYFFLIVRYHY
jgi:hypothetical protein